MLNILQNNLMRNHGSLITIVVLMMFAGSALVVPFMDNATVHATGSNPGQVSSISNVTQVAGGATHSLFLKSDGTVWAVGSNGSGELGDGTTTDRNAAVSVSGITDATQIAAGQFHSLALRGNNSGKVKAWGSGGSGQLGDNSCSTSSSTPVTMIDSVSGTTFTGGGYI